ncbi:MAG: hypothetical protein JNM72_02515 [Deltaproteobacteria bacterium]|nr:hypothetical protein [Deltaproteobacteria bacterium]
MTPYVLRDITSWVHQKIDATGLSAEFNDNRAPGVRCVHPLVTLLEKLDALHRRFPNERAAPQTFVRHDEDAARLALRAHALSPLQGYADVRALAGEMLGQRQLLTMPSVDDVALLPRDDERWRTIRSAHAAIAPMFWGQRLPLEEACASIRGWIAAALT